MLFTGSFKDIDGVKYNVEINSTNETGPAVELTFSSTPCIISGSSEGIFSPIKSRSCTLEIVSTDYYKELYDPISRGTTVKIMRVTGPNESTDYTTIFRGYLTPCEYNQGYSYIDTITLEAVDGISSAKDYKWVSDGTYKTIWNIVLSILQDCGYRGTLYIPRSYTKINSYTTTNREILSLLKVSSNNFIDDDDEHTPWTEYEVLEEILKFLGWSLVPFGDDVYLVDYKAINNGSLDFTYVWINTPGQSGKSTFNLSSILSVENGDFAAGSSSISIDDIYNNIKITDNLYEIDTLCPDIFDDASHISITDEQPRLCGPNGSKWTKTETNWLGKVKNVTVTGYDFQTFCRLNPSTGWKHYWWKHSDQTPLGDSISDPQGYYNSGTYNTSNFRSLVNGVINTQCCVIQHYAYQKEQGKNNIPATIDWIDYLTFFVMDDTTIGRSIYDMDQLELPVLEYSSGESVQWKPATGTSWLTIKGDLWYQYNGAEYNKGKNTLNIINYDKMFYSTAPVDKAVSIDSTSLYGLLLRKPSNSLYGTGFSCWKMKLQIGNKYWNGSSWTTIESTFYIKYNNNPDGENDETLNAFSWMSAVNTNTYKDKVGVDGYCIPIDSNDSSAPSDGVLTLTIYTPSLCPSEVLDMYKQFWPNLYLNVNLGNLSLPVIYCKGFEFGYVYTDTNVWYNNHKDENKKDKLYIGYIDETFKQDFDGLEFKMNTAIKDKPISRSYVTVDTLDDKGYLKKLKHRNSSTAKEQEYNVIDMYLDHYSDRKIIYETNLKGYFNPLQRFTIEQKTDYKSIAGNYIIDTQSFDVAANNNRIKLIEY